jgi:hypothetical protein
MNVQAVEVVAVVAVVGEGLEAVLKAVLRRHPPW